MVEKDFEKINSLNSPQFELNEKFEEGLEYSYYEGLWDSIPNFGELNSLKSGITKGIDLDESSRDSDYGLIFDGFIRLEKDGVYTFHITSDDGSQLEIGNELVIDHDGHHSIETKTVDLPLSEGYHEISLDYFQARGGLGLRLEIVGPDGNTLHSDIYVHK